MDARQKGRALPEIGSGFEVRRLSLVCGNPCRWFQRALTTALVLVSVAFADEPPIRPTDPPASDVPLNIFLNDPADLNSLWKALKRPDFVILRGDEYARLRDRQTTVEPTAPTVDSVIIGGSVDGDLADLTIKLGTTLTADGPAWVPVRLDGQSLISVREGDRDLPVRASEGGAWQVELSKKGGHTVQVHLFLPVRVRPEGRRIELAIPEAGSTRIDVSIARKVVDAWAAVGEPVRLEPAKGSDATRLTAELTPRARLALAWSADEESKSQSPPILSAQGEIAVEVDPGSFRCRSSWLIRSARGSARALQIQLGAGDELIDLEVDGQRPSAGIDRVGGSPRLTITLNEPIVPGKDRRLVLTTRRPTPSGPSARVAFEGFPIVNVREQAGTIGVATSGNLWVSGLAGRGVRRIDPRTELPADLRARPATELAYQFSEQPFGLSLRVEASPPLVRAGDRTTIVIEPGSARVHTWLDVETIRGKIYDLVLGLPPGLEVESVGPPEIAASVHSDDLALAFLPVAARGLKLVTVRLGPKAQESGKFSIQVVGRQALDQTARLARISLFQPVGVTAAGGRVAVLTGPSLTADLAEDHQGAGEFRPALQTTPVDWPWPSGHPPASPPMLWLRHDDGPAVLPLNVTAHPRTLSHATTLNVRVDRREVVVQEELECTAQFGTFDHLDILIPAALAGRWDVEGSAVTSQTELERLPEGDRRVRLKLASELNRFVRLRFRYRLPYAPGLTPEKAVDQTIPWIVLVENGEASSPVNATVSEEPGMTAEAHDESWIAATATEPTDNEATSRLICVGESAPLVLSVSARARAELPRIVASRLAIRTTETPEGDLRTIAWYWLDAYDSGLSFSLPTHAELIQVRVGGEVARGVDRLSGRGGYRVALPARPGPALVEIAYAVPASKTSNAFEPPRLLDGGVVQQTLWEVRVPWSRAAVGVPAGWTDENEWYWDAYVWKRRPWTSSAGLAAWVGLPPSRPIPATDLMPDADAHGDAHSYLFGRPTGPVSMPLLIASRAWLVAACSGSVLALGGLLILVWRPTFRMAWLGLVVVGLLIATMLHPSVVLLAFQSATVGLVLTALLAAMHQLLGRPRIGPFAYGEPTTRAPGLLAQGSTMSHVGAIGSDDSTAIRARPVPSHSTRDHITIPAPSAPKIDDATPIPERGSRKGSEA